jgi:uridine kinase
MRIAICLCGPSGSGKTTLAKMLAQEYGANIISLDNYFLLNPPYKKYEENGKNWELPENVDWIAINHVVASVLQDESTVVRKINWASNTYSESSLTNTDVTVVEGFLLLHDDNLINKCDLLVYIDVPDAIALERRIQREGTNKNRTWFEEITFPEYQPRRELFKKKADVVLDGELSLEQNFSILKERIVGIKEERA